MPVIALPSFAGKGALLVLLALCCQAALGARPTYNYLGVGYARQYIDSADSCTQDGVTLEGSLAANEHVFYGFRHVDVASDEWCGSTTFGLNGGFKADAGRSSSIYALASALVRDIGDDIDVGVGLEAGMRTIQRSGLESLIFLGFEVIDDFDQAYVGGGVNYFFAPRWSLKATGFLTNEDTIGVNLGVRFNL